MARSEGEKVGVSCDTCDFKLTVEGVAEKLEAKRFESVSARRIGQKFGSLGEGHAYFNRGHRVSTHLTDEEIARYLDTESDDEPEVRTDGGTADRERLLRERDACWKHLVAILKRRDKIYRETGEDPLDGAGPWIKAGGLVRDEIPEHTDYEAVDPDDVFRYLDTESDDEPEVRTDGGTAGRERTFHVTIRAEVEAGQLGEWLKENVPPGKLVAIEETNLEGSK